MRRASLRNNGLCFNMIPTLALPKSGMAGRNEYSFLSAGFDQLPDYLYL